MIKKFIRSYLILNLLLLASAAAAQTPSGVIRGTVLDAKSKQPVIGASVSVDGTAMGTATDLEGKFLLTGVPAGPCSVRISFLSYKSFTSGPLTIKGGESTELNVELVEEVSELENVVVVATRKVNSDAGLLSQMREMSLVASGTSAQAIAKTQDRDAAEVVRRIPGISILDDKFVVVRGLAQRYNNVWINGGAVPSSEADTRSFSFDILPSSQLDNMMIVKSPAPEIPGDFSGGFVLIRTKVLPEKNSIQLSYTTGFNNVTNFHDFPAALPTLSVSAVRAASCAAAYPTAWTTATPNRWIGLPKTASAKTGASRAAVRCGIRSSISRSTGSSTVRTATVSAWSAR